MNFSRAGARYDVKRSGGAERGQSLAPEAQGPYVLKIAFPELGGRVPFDRQFEIGRVHAAAIVGDPQ
jgi:hypothetical protein